MAIAALPSLNSLRAFAMVAETGSYTRAGGALNVSHVAVNQKVKALDGRLGVTLVVRQGRGIALTDGGGPGPRSGGGVCDGPARRRGTHWR